MEETIAREITESRHMANWEREMETRALDEQHRLAIKSALKFANEFVKKLPREEREDFKQDLWLELLKRDVQDSKLVLEIVRDLWFKFCQSKGTALE